MTRNECLQVADAILSTPPASPYTERVEGVGDLLARFVVPLDLAKPANRNRHRQAWAMARERSSVLACVCGQLTHHFEIYDWSWCLDGRTIRPMRPEPLPGRPMARAIRFSSVEPDFAAAPHKTVLDVMLPARVRRGRMVPGIGLLRDDKPACLHVVAWWERVPRGSGFQLVEIWSGEKEE